MAKEDREAAAAAIAKQVRERTHVRAAEQLRPERDWGPERLWLVEHLAYEVTLAIFEHIGMYQGKDPRPDY
jgi:hypothetical protein